MWLRLSTNVNLARSPTKIKQILSTDNLVLDCIDCSLTAYRQYFSSSQCCISIVNDPLFAESSFPSKIFDALCSEKIVISYGDVDFSSIKSSPSLCTVS